MTKKNGGKVRWINHYNRNQMILLGGEGDFSFSACLAKAFGSATNMVATSLNSEETLETKHWTNTAHLEYLKKKGCSIFHEVDVYDMNVHPTLMYMEFDVIIYNFPHAGHFCEREFPQKHKRLEEAFFRSAREMVSEGGEVHVTQRDDYPYSEWNLVELAKQSGLVLKEKVEFSKKDYHNKTGGGIESNKQFPLEQTFTFKFSLVPKNS
ncbi:uncharacterized protein At4g26485-like [Pistacia vera]|uniref:uncharacterized protein At4g26485-like n=1 Tax=Pistacia vera TaxID=55513 RepID=UPI0012635141|nr:uncharacterized protein At4g26485-like [Pistacia vera]